MLLTWPCVNDLIPAKVMCNCTINYYRRRESESDPNCMNISLIIGWFGSKPWYVGLVHMCEWWRGHYVGARGIQSHLHCHTVRQAERGPGANVTMWKGVMTGGEKRHRCYFWLANAICCLLRVHSRRPFQSVCGCNDKGDRPRKFVLTRIKLFTQQKMPSNSEAIYRSHKTISGRTLICQ